MAQIIRNRQFCFTPLFRVAKLGCKRNHHNNQHNRVMPFLVSNVGLYQNWQMPVLANIHKERATGEKTFLLHGPTWQRCITRKRGKYSRRYTTEMLYAYFINWRETRDSPQVIGWQFQISRFLSKYVSFLLRLVAVMRKSKRWLKGAVVIVFSLLATVFVYGEWLTMELAGNRWNLPYNEKDQLRILIVADPQLVGFQNEPRFLGIITRWDCDRLLSLVGAAWSCLLNALFLSSFLYILLLHDWWFLCSRW